jgi:hypothetical protein
MHRAPNQGREQARSKNRRCQIVMLEC